MLASNEPEDHSNALRLRANLIVHVCKRTLRGISIVMLGIFESTFSITVSRGILVSQPTSSPCES